MLPEKMSSESSQLMATGCSIQARRSVEVEWPQDTFPQTECFAHGGRSSCYGLGSSSIVQLDVKPGFGSVALGRWLERVRRPGGAFVAPVDDVI